MTWDEPTTVLRQETLFNLACGTANGMAVGGDGGKSVFEKIWIDFSDREVKRMNGNAMKYWGNMATLNAADPQSATVGYLLKNGDGKCGAWAGFYAIAPRVHGINSAEVLIVYGYPFVQFPSVNGVLDLAYFSIVVKPNLAGQGPVIPTENKFDGHAVVVWGHVVPPNNQGVQPPYNGNIWDASYGAVHVGLKKWEENSLEKYTYLQYDPSTGQLLVDNQGHNIAVFVPEDPAEINTLIESAPPIDQ